MTPSIDIDGLAKRFTLHTQGGTVIRVFEDLALTVAAGECVVLHGPSGAGKSSLLRTIFGNYRAERGRILVRHGDGMVDMATAPPRTVMAVRRRTMSHVSQFLRVLPRVPAEAVVAEPLVALGVDPAAALERARAGLARLRIPERLWRLAPATFSGGEQQRVNIARGLIAGHPILLLDEPTAALDADNRASVVELIRQAKARGTAVVGIFHDKDVRDAVADRLFPVLPSVAAH